MSGSLAGGGRRPVAGGSGAVSEVGRADAEIAAGQSRVLATVPAGSTLVACMLFTAEEVVGDAVLRLHDGAADLARWTRTGGVWTLEEPVPAAGDQMSSIELGASPLPHEVGWLWAMPTPARVANDATVSVELQASAGRVSAKLRWLL